MKYFIFICQLVILQFGFSQTVKLDLTVNNIKKVSGVVVISIYNDENSFPIDGREFRKLSVEVSASTAWCTINKLPKGKYAIAIFHDQNADGICNLGLFGVPKEGFGFSKNYRPKLKAPTFDDCKIELLEDMAITINLIFK
jgi:uncharacterized protein (DUF2141 family)